MSEQPDVQTVIFMPYCCQIHWIRYCETVYERDVINRFWSIKNSSEVLNKFKSKDFKASKLSTSDFYRILTPYTVLPHHLIKDYSII